MCETIMVSACLLGENCKYSGGNNYNEAVVTYLKNKVVIPVCPEVLGGLSIPRPPAEIVDGVVRTGDGASVDGAFRSGAEKALKLALEHNVDCAILQSRSPSCGVHEIYDGTFTGTKIPGMGVFARRLKENNILLLDAETIDSEV